MRLALSGTLAALRQQNRAIGCQPAPVYCVHLIRDSSSLSEILRRPSLNPEVVAAFFGRSPAAGQGGPVNPVGNQELPALILAGPRISDSEAKPWLPIQIQCQPLSDRSHPGIDQRRVVAQAEVAMVRIDETWITARGTRHRGRQTAAQHRRQGGVQPPVAVANAGEPFQIDVGNGVASEQAVEHVQVDAFADSAADPGIAPAPTGADAGTRSVAASNTPKQAATKKNHPGLVTFSPPCSFHGSQLSPTSAAAILPLRWSPPFFARTNRADALASRCRRSCRPVGYHADRPLLRGRPRHSPGL